MKKIISSVFAILISVGIVHAAEYKIDTAHSSVEFKIRHLVGNTKGQFNEFEGMLDFDENDIRKSSVTATIKTASIDTNNEKRDDHLRGTDFFDVATYPSMTFKSIAVEDGKLIGDLTLHGVTRQVVMALEVNGVGPDPWGNSRAGFTATTTIDRQDFGMNYNKNMDQGGLMLGNEVKIILEIEAIAV